ncbi:trigger factor [Brevibacterium gallinarum]|uniref:Trigger factor n=1 Tax=Brevibacterium gallinarum TaxID=2762220 RepID=A0ABR8WT99_9MICO|nr:trigger factor [Brevibacterium gallinarum]MBD8020299.1 trigger factor [Brevibacterium gallinarum]
MKSSVENLDPTRVKLSVEAPYAELKPSIDEAYKEISKQITIPGFRRGKVPARIIDQRVGRPAVLQEAVNNSLDDFYRQALNENDVRPLGSPEVEVSEIPGLDGAEEGNLVFTVEVDCMPNIELPAYDSIEVEVDTYEVTDEDIDKEIDELRARFGTLNPVDRPAAEGDFVTIDLTAKVDDEVIDEATDISYEVGARTMIDGLDDALVDLSEGEETTFSTTLAGGEHKGSEGVVTVKLNAVKERVLADADDDFAQMASGSDTIEELREETRENVAKQKELEQSVQAREKVLDALLEMVELPLPEKFLAEEVSRQVEAAGAEEGDERYQEIQDETAKAVRTQFLLDAIAEKEEVEVSQAELIEYIMAMAQQYGMQPQEFIQMLQSSGQVPAISGEVARRKGLAAVLAEATVVDTEGNAVDMTKFVTQESEEDDEDGDDAEAEADETADAADDAEAEKKD